MRTRTPGRRWFDSPDDFNRRCREWGSVRWGFPSAEERPRETSVEELLREWLHAWGEHGVAWERAKR